jgi:hypothetical protein
MQLSTKTKSPERLYNSITFPLQTACAGLMQEEMDILQCLFNGLEVIG